MSLQYGGHRRRFYKNSFAGFNMSLVTVQLTVTEYLPLCHLYSVHTRLNKQVESGFILHSDFLNSSLLAKVFLPKIRRMVTSILGILFVFTLPKYCSQSSQSRLKPEIQLKMFRNYSKACDCIYILYLLNVFSIQLQTITDNENTPIIICII